MPHPLRNARLRVEAAERCLPEIDKLLFDWLAEIRLQSVPHTPLRAEWVARIPEPPERLDVLVGEVIENLRSAMEYVAWELAVQHHGSSDFTGHDRVTFPVVDDASKWTGWHGRRWFADEDYARLERLQPFWTAQPVSRWLHDLWNIQKHRRLHTVAMGPVHVRVLDGVFDGPYPRFENLVAGRQVVDGTVVMRLKWGPFTRELQRPRGEVDWIPVIAEFPGRPTPPLWEALQECLLFVRFDVFGTFAKRLSKD